MEQVKVVQKGNIASKVETTQKNTKKKNRDGFICN